MRGKVRETLHIINNYRITPAYAGKRPGDPFQDIIARDHPRLCGEKSPMEDASFESAGSPPPMRGKAVTGIWLQLIPGITPAYAGKSCQY